MKVVDRKGGRRGRYRQDIEVEPYPVAGLRVSDLELAWKVEESKTQSKFRKGPLHVVPMPTRTYGEGQSVSLYYEIYNLTKDEFGQTRYRIAYSLGGAGKAGTSSIARLTRIVGGRQEIAVASEQSGTETTEVQYVELSPGEHQEGRQALQVTVTDLNSGDVVQKQVAFVTKGTPSRSP